MNALNICIDIDGTLTEPYYWLPMTNHYFNKNVTEEMITEYAIHEVMGIERQEYDKFYQKNKFKMHRDQKLRSDVKPILNTLSTLHNLYFVTARETDLEMLTHVYLRKNSLPYDGLFVLGSCYKVAKARELNCDLFIEDHYDNALQLSNKGFKVLLLDTAYNRKPLNENIIRVNDWKEIFHIINALSQQNKAI
jgi:uncharacterized HAD superfamily protein